MPGMTSAGNTPRIPVAPAAMTLAGSTEGALLGNSEINLATRDPWAAETKRAPPTVWKTITGG